MMQSTDPLTATAPRRWSRPARRCVTRTPRAPVIGLLLLGLSLPGLSLLCLLPAASVLAQTSAQTPATTGAETIPPAIPEAIPDPPSLSATGHLLIDHDSGVELAAANADARLEPASLTKLMTAYVVFSELAAGNIALDDTALISEKAWRTGGSKMFVELNSRVSIKDLLLGVIVQSGNDACVALAEHIAGTEEGFAALMNRHAERLGMTRSNFTNASGLPDPNLYTTPRDIARLAAASIRDFPEFYAWYSTPEFTFNGIRQHNRNRLLRLDPSVDGMKTGHTEAAGYCLVATAKRDGQRLLSVVMGTPSESARANDSLALLNYGFRFFETHPVYPAGEPVEQLRVWSGDPITVGVGPLVDLAVTIPRGRYGELTAHLEPIPSLTAPLARGDVVGDIVFLLGDAEIQRQPAVALDDVPRGGLLRRAADSLLRLF